ncbi:hypothetical protein ScPMuIL_006298 [Solemya velum]
MGKKQKSQHLCSANLRLEVVRVRPSEDYNLESTVEYTIYEYLPVLYTTTMVWPDFVGVVVAILTISYSGVAVLDFQYHNNSQVESFLLLRSITTAYPNLTHLYSIGRSVRGQELWVIAIGRKPTEHIPLRPHVKYTGNMHGNEPVGRELLLHLVEHLVQSYSTNNTIEDFLDTTLVHLLPSLNPDGFDVSEVGECNGVDGRTNQAHSDLNRDFPDFFIHRDYEPQPETKAVMRWNQMYQFSLCANFHGGALVASYPFDNYDTAQHSSPYYSRSPDNDVLRHLSLVYSRTHPEMHTEPLCYGERFPDGITNGAFWYPIQGGMQDYDYIQSGCMGITLEVSCCKYPQPDELAGHWDKNRDALINYLLQVHMGVKGVIIDASGRGIEGAKLTIQSREVVPFKSSHDGEFWRLLLPGQYTLQVEAPGCRTQTVDFTVDDGVVSLLKVNMGSCTEPITTPKTGVTKRKNIFLKIWQYIKPPQ